MSTPNCDVCQKKIFAAEKPIQVPGFTCHDACFKCKSCNIKLTLHTYTSFEKNVYCKAHVPKPEPNQTIDVTMATAMAAPDSNHNTVAFQKSTGDSSYGSGAVGVESAINAPKKPEVVGNINRMEVRHQGTDKFESA